MLKLSSTTDRVSMPNQRQLLAARAGSILSARLDPNAGPSVAGLAWKLALLAVFAAVLTAGSERPLATLCTLLEALYCFGAALSAALAILHRQKPAAASFTYWHETLVFAGAAMLSHLAVRALG